MIVDRCNYHLLLILSITIIVVSISKIKLSEQGRAIAALKHDYGFDKRGRASGECPYGKDVCVKWLGDWGYCPIPIGDGKYGMRCKQDGICELGKCHPAYDNVDGVCGCPVMKPFDKTPVCGSDNRTYNNEWEVAIHSCWTKTKITVQSRNPIEVNCGPEVQVKDPTHKCHLYSPSPSPSLTTHIPTASRRPSFLPYPFPHWTRHL